MTANIWLALAVASLFAAAAWLAIWSRTGTWARPVAVALFLIGLPTIAAAAVEALGQHRPLWTAWQLPPGDHLIVGVKMVQDRAIYIYLDTGREAPWPLVLPWSNSTADALQKALDGAPEGREGQALFRYDPSLDDNEQQFHPLPQSPALPPKPVPQAAPHFNMEGS